MKQLLFLIVGLYSGLTLAQNSAEEVAYANIQRFMNSGIAINNNWILQNNRIQIIDPKDRETLTLALIQRGTKEGPLNILFYDQSAPWSGRADQRLWQMQQAQNLKNAFQDSFRCLPEPLTYSSEIQGKHCTITSAKATRMGTQITWAKTKETQSTTNKFVPDAQPQSYKSSRWQRNYEAIPTDLHEPAEKIDLDTGVEQYIKTREYGSGSMYAPRYPWSKWFR